MTSTPAAGSATPAATGIRDRVLELRRVPAGELKAHPDNWRTHGAEQRTALRAVLERIGFAGALLGRLDAGGELQVLDGHLRAAEVAPEVPIPVLVTDLSEEEGRVLLATYDALGAMAGTDRPKFEALAGSLRVPIAELLGQVEAADPAAAAGGGPGPESEGSLEPQVRQLVLFLRGARYGRLVDRLTELQKRWGLDSPSEAAIRAIEVAHGRLAA